MTKEAKKKSKLTPKLIVMMGVVVLVSLITSLVVFLDEDDLIKIFRYIQRVTFIATIPILILSLFWKAIRKLGLIWILLMILVGIVGQFVDRVIRRDVGTHYYEAEGISFYGDVISSYDIDESYQKEERSPKGENK